MTDLFSMDIISVHNISKFKTYNKTLILLILLLLIIIIIMQNI